MLYFIDNLLNNRFKIKKETLELLEKLSTKLADECTILAYLKWYGKGGVAQNKD